MLGQPFCRLCGEEETVIYSGVDALSFGVPVEKFCYDCARVIHSEIFSPQLTIYGGNK